MTDKSEKRLSAIAHLHNALYLISRQQLFAAYISICRALEDSGEKLEASEAIFERFTRISPMFAFFVIKHRHSTCWFYPHITRIPFVFAYI